MPDAVFRSLRVPDWVGAPVVVGCSGGADSLALLVLAAGSGLAPIAVYVDHGLRPGTVAEATLVGAAASSLGAESRAVVVDVDPGPGLEARARVERYRALERVRDEAGASAVLVGHTADDQAETALLNLLRGAGTAGLGGMAGARGRVVRPVLHLRRSDTVEICARAGLAPSTDPMNADTTFRRVWLRRELIPWLEAVADRDLRALLARQARLMHEDSEFLDGLAEEQLGGVRAPAPLPLESLSAPEAVRRRVVRRWLGGAPPSLEHVERLLALAEGGAPVELPGGRRVEVSGGALHLLGSERRAGFAEPVSLRVPGSKAVGPFVVETWIERAAPAAWPDGRWACVLDADRVGEDVVVRAARPGERIDPLGTGGSKKITSVLADAGVPPSLRRGVPVLCGSGGTPLWVLGYRVGAPARVTASTRRYLWATVERSEIDQPERLTS